MKRLLITCLLFISLKTYSQIIADPALGQISFTDLLGNAISDTLPIGYVAQLTIPIKNLDPVNTIPMGSCKLKIGLGTKMIIDPSFVISGVNSSVYFDWSAEFIGGQIQITGDLKAPLPPNYSTVEKFNVYGNVLGYSTITANFLVSNHNTLTILSDGNSTNNSSFRQYKIIPVITPVTFTRLSAVKKDCSIDISFGAEDEINVHHYEIEVSKDGRTYNNAGIITAAHLINYKYQFLITESTTAPLLYIRIKSVDRDAVYKYSITTTVNAVCSKKSVLVIFPNPVTNQQDVTVSAVQGLLNGRYSAAVYDMAGKLISVKEFLLNNQQQFTYPFGKIATGQYLIKVTGSDNAEVIFKIQKR